MVSTQYVVGFLFRRNNTEVALIRKNKPDWQRGKLNGIGGKIEDGESSRVAMIREFKEETGCVTKPTEWRFFLTLALSGATITFFESRAGDTCELTTTTDGAVEWFPIEAMSYTPSLIPNLRWLLPLALDETAPAGVMNGNG